MAISKKAKLAGALSTKPKKALPDVEQIEQITKKVYDKPSIATKNSTPKRKTATRKAKPKPLEEEKIQKTTLDLPKSLHLRAKIFSMEQGVSLKEYIAGLIRTDLKKNGKLD